VELLPILRRLWRRKAALGIGLVLAIGAAAAIGGSPPAASEVAWTRVVLDTPKSELVQSAPGGSDTLAWRASLLIHLMGTDAEGRALAQRLGVPPYEVDVMDEAYTFPEVPASMPVRAAAAASTTAAPYVLTLGMDDPVLPVIAIKAAAPQREAAVRLAAAAVARLEAQASPVAAPYSSKILTGGGAALKRQQFTVQQVAPIRTKRETARSLPTKQIAVIAFVFGAWFTGTLLCRRILRRRPRLAAAA
jgi:hypothetical protein